MTRSHRCQGEPDLLLTNLGIFKEFLLLDKNQIVGKDQKMINLTFLINNNSYSILTTEFPLRLLSQYFAKVNKNSSQFVHFKCRKKDLTNSN